jgi:two-component system phosphate regulon sensor histidine kinase PhoR
MESKDEFKKLIDSIEDKTIIEKYYNSLKTLQEGKPDVWAERDVLKAEVTKLKQEKEKFFSVVSFWLGSPLNSLKTLSTMLAGDTSMDKGMMLEFVKHLHSQIIKIHKLMGNLITWSDMEVNNFTFQPSTFSLKSIAEEVIKENLEHAQKKGIDLQNSVSEDIKVEADQEALKKVMDNLVQNSVKFTTKDGKVEILAENEGDKVKITVKDTGIGMGKAKIAAIFNSERKNAQKGTANEDGFGIGMPLVKSLLALHQSTPEILSDRGAGCSVSFLVNKGKE